MKRVVFCFARVVFSGPAAFCQRSQRSVPVSLPTQHAQQSGARSAAVEAAGPGAEEVCVRPPCRAQLICPVTKATENPQKSLSLIETLVCIVPLHLWLVPRQKRNFVVITFKRFAG